MVGAFAVLGEVEAFALDFLARTKPDHLVDHPEEDERDETGPDQGDEHRLDLDPHLEGVARKGELDRAWLCQIIGDALTAERRIDQDAG